MSRGGAHRARTRRRLLALISLTAALGWGVLPAGAVIGQPGAVDGAATTVEDATGLPVQVVVSRVSPQALAPGRDLGLDLVVTNSGTETVTQPRVIVRIQRSGFISRTSLDRWRRAGTTADAGAAVLEVDLPGPLEPGASAPVGAVVPAASIGLRPTAPSWGVRGLAVEVVDAADPARVRLGLVRTFTVWLPPQEVVPTTVTVLVPVVGPAPGPEAAAELAELTAAGGRLDGVLRSTTERAVTWVLDPALLEAQPAVVQDGTTDGSRQHAAWLTTLLAAAPQDVQLLPYGDADLTALAHARTPDLLDLADDRGRALAAGVGLGAGTSLGWPGEDLPDLVTAAAVARSDAALVVGPGALPPPSVLTYTPTARTSVGTAAGDVTVLVPDDRLSTALVTGRVGRTDEDGSTAGPDPQLTGAVAAADLLAELAVVTRERPSDGRHLLLTVPRDWDPDPTVAAAQLAALSAVPWVATAPVEDLIARPAETDRGSLPERVSGTTEVSAEALAAVRAAVVERERVAAMGSDPQALLGDSERELLVPTALAWRDDPAGRAAVVAGSAAATARLRSGVQVLRGSDLTLVASSGELPVRVGNTLDQDVVVVLRLRPGSPQLVVDQTVELSIGAGQEVSTTVPVHAVQSADVPVVAELLTVDGVLVNDSARMVVRVRADWEGIGAAVVGSLLAVGVVVGLIRTIRRGRGRRMAPQADVGPDDLSPEQSEQVTADTTTEVVDR